MNDANRPRISVLVIAHNEGAHIEECLRSLQNQTRTPHEVVVVNHNSTDETGDRARAFPVTVIDYTGPVGPTYARIRGFELVTGDMVLCIDGDAVAAPNWVETMSDLLMQPNMVMVGSWIQMKGPFFLTLSSWNWYLHCSRTGQRAADFMWGASMGLWVRDRAYIIAALKKGLELSERLGLAYNPDDYWLALFMGERGTLAVRNTTSVTAYAKEVNTFQAIRRALIATGIRTTMHRFLATEGLPKLS